MTLKFVSVHNKVFLINIFQHSSAELNANAGNKLKKVIEMTRWF